MFNWLVSYPKSGNTWLRILLSNYLNESETEWDMNDQLLGSSRHLSRFEFEEHMGFNSSEIPRSSLDRFRRDWHSAYAQSFSDISFTKVHERYRSRYDALPLFPAVPASKVIYLGRNPLDLVGSLAHHDGISIEQAIEQMADQDRTLRSNETHFQEFMGSWSDHVLEWLDQTELETLTVTYEALLKDTAGQFERVVRFSGLEWKPEIASKAIAASRFDLLRNQEREQGFREGSIEAENFFRKGRSGGWREELTREQAQIILSHHGDAMQRLGYDVCV